MRIAVGWVGSVWLGVLLVSGCASPAKRAVRPRAPIRPPHEAAASGTSPGPAAQAAPADSLETTIGKIRELSARARPVPKHRAGTSIEIVDRQLAAALLALRVWPSAAAHRRVAQEYVRVRVLDAAFDHYRAALRIDPADAGAYDGLARIWRDWHLPALGLGDARRAVFYAPHSAEAHNTLGTVLHALGRRDQAKDAYERSAALDPRAAYALNNLGYVLLLEGDRRAREYFGRALAIDPGMLAARHNLALAYAAGGRVDLAKRELRAADSPPVAAYNLGVINLAVGDPSGAAAAFEEACVARVGIRWACERYRGLTTRAGAAEGTP